MDFIQQFLSMALGRLQGGNTAAQTDQGSMNIFGGLFGGDDSSGGLGNMNYHGIGLSSLQSAKMAYDATNDENLSGRQKGQRVAEGVGKLVGDWFTGGKISPIMNRLDTQYPGIRDTIEKIDVNINPLANLLGRLWAPKGEKGIRNPF